MSYQDTGKFNDRMYPKGLPFAQREEFRIRYERAIARATERYGEFPSYKVRAAIVGALRGCFLHQRVGSASFGRRLLALQGLKHLREKVAREGHQWRDFCVEKLARGRKGPKPVERSRSVRATQEGKDWRTL